MVHAISALRGYPKLWHANSVHKQPANTGQAFECSQKNQDALHEAGKYFSGKPLLAAGPQRQLVIGLPPSVLPLTTVLPL
jgi:hypothetical protein